MKHAELEGWQRYAVLFGGMLAAGAACSFAVPFLIAPRGSFGPSALQAESPAAAVTALVICLGLATGVGVVVGRLVNTAVGLFVVGCGLWLVRLRTGTVQDLVFADGSLGLVAVETALWGLLVLGSTLVVFRFAGPLSDIEPPEQGETAWWQTLGLRGAAAGALIIPAVWLFARSDLKGQTLMAVVLGGLAVGLVGRLLSPTAQPRLIFATVCVFGAVGQVIGMLMLREPLIDAFVVQSIPALCLPMPIDYAAGSLTGVAMGLGWAKSFLQHDETAEAMSAVRGEKTG